MEKAELPQFWCLLLKEVNNGRGLTLQFNMDLSKCCLFFQSLLHMVAVLKPDVQTQPEHGPILMLKLGKKSLKATFLCAYRPDLVMLYDKLTL